MQISTLVGNCQVELVEDRRNKSSGCILRQKMVMTERELIKLEATIRKKMDDIKSQRVSLKNSGIGGLMNTLKKVDEALYEKLMPDYKKMVAERNIFK
jgi:hypothetical protein